MVHTFLRTLGGQPTCCSPNQSNPRSNRANSRNSSIPCTPLLLSTLWSSLEHQSIKETTQWPARCVDAREQPFCSHAIVLAPVEETT